MRIIDIIESHQWCVSFKPEFGVWGPILFVLCIIGLNIAIILFFHITYRGDR